MQNFNKNRCGSATGLAAGKQPVGLLPTAKKKGFVSFVGFVTNKKRIKQQINKIKV